MPVYPSPMPPPTPPGSRPSKVFPYDIRVSIFPAPSQTYSSQIGHNLDAVQATSISWIDHSSHSSNPLQTSCLRAACLGHSTRWTHVDYVQEAGFYRESFVIWYSITLSGRDHVKRVSLPIVSNYGWRMKNQLFLLLLSGYETHFSVKLHLMWLIHFRKSVSHKYLKTKTKAWELNYLLSCTVQCNPRVESIRYSHKKSLCNVFRTEPSPILRNLSAPF